MEIDSIIANFDFDLWFSENEKLLVELFIIYAICFKYIPSEQTIGFKVSKLCSNNSGIVCSIKVKDRIIDLRSKLIDHFGEENLENEIRLIKEKIKGVDNKLLRFVSGKDYLLPLVITRLKSFLKFPSISTGLRIRLAMKSEVEELSEIENYIFPQ